MKPGCQELHFPCLYILGEWAIPSCHSVSLDLLIWALYINGVIAMWLFLVEYNVLRFTTIAVHIYLSTLFWCIIESLHCMARVHPICLSLTNECLCCSTSNELLLRAFMDRSWGICFYFSWLYIYKWNWWVVWKRHVFLWFIYFIWYVRVFSLHVCKHMCAHRLPMKARRERQILWNHGHRQL